MSDTGQGGGQRSWWEKPDADPQPQDPYATGSPDQGQSPDAYDPYRAPAPDAPTQAHPTTPAAPTQSLPSYGQQAPEPAPNPYGDAPYGNDQHPQQFGPQPPNQPYGGQYGNQQYGQQHGQQYANQPYGNQQYPPYPHDQPPVTGMAHAVLWTSVGGILLSWTLLGWVASIVALALTPGARREILAANGARRGLGFLLAGKIIAWVNIGLTVLGVIGVLAFFGWLGAQGWQYDDGGSFDPNQSVLFTR